MIRLEPRRKIQVVLALLALTIVAYAKITGPEARYTNAPGDLGNCTACHDHPGQINSGPGSMTLTSNIDTPYQTGKQYTLTITVRQSGRQRFGFQLTAIDSKGNRAGTLAPVNPDAQVNVDTGVGGRQYINHTEVGTLANGQGSRTWLVRWTAPNNDPGTIRFYLAGNAADNDGTNQGNDFIYTSVTFIESPTSLVTATLDTRPDNLTLEAGTAFPLAWTVTNQSNVDSYELRYSTDDGMTFPISNLMFGTTSAGVTTFNWNVPNVPTDQARIRLLVATKSGTATEIVSGRFTITPSGNPGALAPRILNASITGKHLFVDGENFQMGAKVEINGTTTKTSNLDDFSHNLKCKKGAKKLTSGVEATLVVRNPDGTRSAPYPFTKP
ncbi:MAG TPA: choice-of-anchor V domain-containing protein [Blastocatellia bacterium]|nr:choice-of-anchor V domain-containing protein [Blastocatellia bacterium]